MSESLLLAVEIIFDVLYLITVWTLVALMLKKRGNLLEENKKIGGLFIWAFFLLALGDTGHVGFRVLRMLLAVWKRIRLWWNWRAGNSRNGNILLHAGSRNLASSL